MTDYTTRSPEEARTHELLSDRSDCGQIEQMVRNTFIAMYWSSLSVRKIKAISEAMNSMTITETKAIQKVLTSMVRRGMLRSRVDFGVRFYEVNY